MTDAPLPLFDPLIHAPHRLRICATLEPWEEYEFAGLRDVVGVSDSVLSKQLTLLQSARYVLLRRANQSGRQRVWVRLTELGREAFAGHVAALREIVGESRPAQPSPSSPVPLTPSPSSRETSADRVDAAGRLPSLP